jgi:hypothetical protein
VEGRDPATIKDRKQANQTKHTKEKQRKGARPTKEHQTRKGIGHIYIDRESQARRADTQSQQATTAKS